MRRFVALLLLGSIVPAAAARGDEPLFREVSVRDLERNGSRFYLAGILGSSFATVTSPGTPSSSEPLFTAGGAAGVAFTMLDRAWRLEVEGRARDPLSETATLDEFGSTSEVSATGGWSTTVTTRLPPARRRVTGS